LDRLTPTIAELTQAIEQEADKCTEAQRLHTPEVGSLTALAFVLIIGSTKRFQLWQADRELSGAGAPSHADYGIAKQLRLRLAVLAVAASAVCWEHIVRNRTQGK